jgi:hypothetical protein
MRGVRARGARFRRRRRRRRRCRGCARAHDRGEFERAVELQALHDAEAVAQRCGEQSGARGRADQRERRQVELDRARGRAFADHDVDLEIFERRIEHFLDDRRQAMDLVDEKHVAWLQVGQQRGEVAGTFQHRAGRRAQVHAEFVGDDMRERRLAQPRRPEDEHVVERVSACARLRWRCRVARAPSSGRGIRRAAAGGSTPRRGRLHASRWRR